MRITINIDGQQADSVKTDAGSGGGGGQPGASMSAAEANQGVGQTSSGAPAEVLALAAATGAINAGPAPIAAGQQSAAPHPFLSPGSGMSETERAAATSGGSAQSGKPCG